MRHQRFIAATLLTLILSTSTARGDVHYEVTDLGPVPAPVIGNSYLGINAIGQVTGALLGNSETATVWKPSVPNGASGMTFNLGTLGGTFAQTNGANSSGQVAGVAAVASGKNHAFMWKPTSPNGTTGTMYDLGTLGGLNSSATSINDRGQVTGVANNLAFLWRPPVANGTSGTMFTLGTLGDYSEGDAINAGGQVAGISFLSFGSPHPFLWTPTVANGPSGTLLDLVGLGGDQGGFATGISIGGMVVGSAYTTDNAALHAFLYDGTMHDLGTLTGPSAISEGHAINDAGQVVGASADPLSAFHAFVYDSASGMVDLNSLIDSQLGWSLERALAVNNAGQIAGYGILNGQAEVFLLTPVPEPSTFVLIGIGVLSLCCAVCRRTRTIGWVGFHCVEQTARRFRMIY